MSSIAYNLHRIELRILRGHEKNILSLEFIDSNRLVSGSSDYTIRIWDIDQGSCIKVLAEHSGPISAILSLPGFIISGDNSTIRIWNNSDYSLVRTLTSHTGQIWELASDMQYLCSASFDGTVGLWNIQ